MKAIWYRVKNISSDQYIPLKINIQEKTVESAVLKINLEFERTDTYIVLEADPVNSITWIDQTRIRQRPFSSNVGQGLEVIY